MTDLIARLKAGLPIETAISANAACRVESAMAEAAVEIETLRRQLAAERALLDALQANGWELRRTLDYAHGHAAPIIGWAVRRWREDTQSLDCIAHALDDDPRAAIRKAQTVQAKATESAEPAPAEPAKDETFTGPEDTDTPLMAAAREAGWALREIVDGLDWDKREQVSEITYRLAVALREIDTSSETVLLTVISQIREKSGVGGRPMLSELADAIAARIAETRKAALMEAITDNTSAAGWQSIETAPWDETIIVWWPIVALDEDGDPTDTIEDGRAVVAEWNGGCWLEPEVLNAIGEHMGDDSTYADNPSHWMPLPPGPPPPEG